MLMDESLKKNLKTEWKKSLYFLGIILVLLLGVGVNISLNPSQNFNSALETSHSFDEVIENIH